MTTERPGAGPPATPHLDEGTLVRLVDGELAGDERARVETHLAACDGCRARLDELRARDEAVRAWLLEHDPVPPGRASYDLGPAPRSAGAGTPVPWARVAVVLVALGVAVGPARGWILDRVGWRASSGAEGPSAPAPPESAGAATTAFLPVGPEVVLDLSVRGGLRELTVEVAPDPRVRFVAGQAGAELLLRGARLEVRDAAADARSYRLFVPAGIRRVRVVRGGGAADTVLTVASDGARRRLILETR